jgi:hypothetical protein
MTKILSISLLRITEYSDQKEERRKSDNKRHCISLLRVTKHFDHYAYRKPKN